MGDSSTDIKNVILLTIDGLRPDFLSCYKKNNTLAPFLSSIGDESVIFNNAITSSSWTDPSIATIHTSTYSPNHGLRLNGQKLENLDTPTISEVLQEEGFSTIGAVGIESLNRRFNFHRGFKKFFDHNKYDRFLTSVGYKKYNLLNFGRFTKLIHPKYYHTKDGLKINNDIFNYISKSNITSPTFLWIHFFDILRYRHQQHYTYLDNKRQASKSDYLDWYDEGVKKVDNVVRNLFEQLTDLGLLEDSLVVITADHGEHLFQRNEKILSHGYSLYDEDLKVPLILFNKNLFEPKIIENLVGSIDIFPTILELLNIKMLENFQGQSLVPLIQGNNISEDRRIFSEAIAGDKKSVRTNEWKLIWAGDNQLLELGGTRDKELFNIREDPSEKHNVIEKNPELALSLGKDLSRVFPEIKNSDFNPKNLINEMDDDVKTLLKNLGYIK